MSEAEKRKRLQYKEQRKRRIMIQLTVIAVLFVMLFAAFLTYLQLNETHYIEYTERGSIGYRVSYVPTDEYEEWQKKGQSYITGLTDDVLVDFEYEMAMQDASVDYEYSYTVEAQLQIYDTREKKPIYDPIYTLVPEKAGEKNSDSTLQISEAVMVDFSAYNLEAEAFLTKYLSQYKDVKATLLVYMDVEVTGMSDSFESHERSSYRTTLSLPLAGVTFAPTTSESVPSGENRVLAYRNGDGIAFFRGASITLLILTLASAAFLLAYIYLTRNEDINYTIKVKRLVSQYRSFIQELTGEFNEEGFRVLPLASFRDMLAVRDTIQSPILMNENEDRTRTRFLIPTNTNMLYTFEIKVDNYDELYAKQEAPAEEAPAVSTALVPVEEVLVIEEAPMIETVEMIDGGELAIGGELLRVRYRTSFRSRLIQASRELKECYSALKNELLAYRGVKARAKWDFEFFRKGRSRFAGLDIRDGAVCLYLAMDPTVYNRDMAPSAAGSALNEVPILVKLRSRSGLHRAFDLIADVMKKRDLPRTGTATVDYCEPYETTEELLRRGFIKVILPDGHTADETAVLRSLGARRRRRHDKKS